MEQKSKDKDDTQSEDTGEGENKTPKLPKEHGGYEASGLPEPTRFGDWEVRGRCSDF